MDFSRLHTYTPPQCVPDNTGYTYALPPTYLSPVPAFPSSSSYSSDALDFESEHKLDPVFDSPRMSRRSLRPATTKGQSVDACSLPGRAAPIKVTARRAKQQGSASKPALSIHLSGKGASSFSHTSSCSLRRAGTPWPPVLDESLICEQTKVDHFWGLDDDGDPKGGNKVSTQGNGDLLADVAASNGYTCPNCNMQSTRTDVLTAHQATHVPTSRVYSRDRNSRQCDLLMQVLHRTEAAVWSVAQAVWLMLWLSITAPGDLLMQVLHRTEAAVRSVAQAVWLMFWLSITAPGKVASGTFWWLGSGWYQFVTLISWLNVFLLTRCLRNICKFFIMLLPLLLLVGTGFFLWNQNFLSFPWVLNRTAMHTAQPQVYDSEGKVRPNPASPSLPPQADFGASQWQQESDVAQQVAAVTVQWRSHDQRLGELEVLVQKLQMRVDQVDSGREGLSLWFKDVVGRHLQEMGASETHDTKGDANIRETVKLMFSEDQHSGFLESLLQNLSSRFVSRAELQVLLRNLELQVLKNVTHHITVSGQALTSEAIVSAVNEAGISGITEAQVHVIVNNALKQYSQDKIGMVDFALESSGGSILSTRCSETYETKTALLSLFGIPLWYFSHSPRIVIQDGSITCFTGSVFENVQQYIVSRFGAGDQPDIYPGNCWAFKGSQGYLVVRLSMMIHPTAFTMEHVPKALSPTGSISSAPRDFAVYGLENEYQEEGKLLGQFTYNQEGESLQVFHIMEVPDRAFQIVELRILSNWGHLEYTCLYRFRVHGEPVH